MYNHLFLFSDCSGNCDVCSGHWTCSQCDSHYRVEDETDISCIGVYTLHIIYYYSNINRLHAATYYDYANNSVYHPLPNTKEIYRKSLKIKS